MCYPQPGPRCSAYAAEMLIKAKVAARNRMTFETEEAVKDAELEYDATPAGMKELERRITQYKGQQQTEYALRLQLGKAKRAERLTAIKKQDAGDVKHDMSYDAVYPDTYTQFASTYNSADTIANDDPVINTIIKDSSNWVSQLNADEIEAVSWYTSSGSGTINNHLLGTKNPWGRFEGEPELINSAVTHMDSALEKSRRNKPVKVYRGVSKEILGSHGYEWDDAPKYVAENFTVGSTFTSPVFMSSTLDFQKAEGFSPTGVMLEILAKKAGSVSNVSAWGVSEKEFILPRNQEYKVIGIKSFTKKIGKDYTKEYRVVQLQEM